VVAVEANRKAVMMATRLAKQEGYGSRLKLMGGLSTDDAVFYEVAKEGPYDAIVHEILGFFAGGEGAAAVVADLHQRCSSHKRNSSGSCGGGTRSRRKSGVKEDNKASPPLVPPLPLLPPPPPPLTVPCRAATFFSPVLLTRELLEERTTDIYYAIDSFLLMKRFPITTAMQASGGSGSRWCRAGLVEYLDFMSPETLAVKQCYSTTFVSSNTWARVNGLACWMWCETSPYGGEKRRGEKGGYPWDCRSRREGMAGEVLGGGGGGGGGGPLSPTTPTSANFSSRVDDDSRCASNWRNAIIPLPQVVLVPPSTPLRVVVQADLRTTNPSYIFTTYLHHQLIHTTTIRNLYPTFTKDN